MNIKISKFLILLLLFKIHNLCQRGCLSCQQNEGGLCLYCDNTQGFILENGFCIDTYQVDCMKFSDNQNCIQCIPFHKFFVVQTNNQTTKVCQQTFEQNCMIFDYIGQCLKCTYDHYLQNKICIKVDSDNLIKGCTFYDNQQKCSQCKLDYFLINSDCIKIEDDQKVENCIEYSQQKCSSCKDNYQYDNNSYYLTYFDKLYGNDQITELFQYDYLQQIYYSKEQCFKKNIENCLIYKNNLQCQICNNGFYLNQKICIQNPKQPIFDCDIHKNTNLIECQFCSIQSFLTISQQCNKLQDQDTQLGCLRYQQINESIQCISCDSNYYIQLGKCIQRQQVVENCLYFDKYKDSCMICQQNYIINQTNDQNHCIEKLQNCKLAQDNICIQCDAYYYLKNSECIQGQDQYCLQYKNNICIECQLQYQLVNNICKEQNINYKNCKNLENSGDLYTCTQCVKGYQNIQIISHCQQHDENCEIYDYNINICKQCKQNYYIKQDKCVQKFCKEFDANLNCIKCNSYYELIDQICIESEYNLYSLNKIVLVQQENCQQNQILYSGSLNICLQKQYEITNCSQYQRINGEVLCIGCQDNLYLSNDNKQCLEQCQENEIHIISYINSEKQLKCQERQNHNFQYCQEIIQFEDKKYCNKCLEQYGIIENCGEENNQVCTLIDELQQNCYKYEYNNNKLICKQCQFGYKFQFEQTSQQYICIIYNDCDTNIIYNIDQETNQLFTEVSNETFENIFSCHKLKDSSDKIQVLQQQVNLDTGLSYIDKQILIQQKNEDIVDNCAFSVQFKFGSDIDYKCLACNPGYKPSYGFLFIEQCTKIQNCDINTAQLQLNKCQKCENNFRLSIDKQSCIQEDNLTLYNLKQQIPNCLDSDYLKIIKQNDIYTIQNTYQGCTVCATDQIKLQLKGQHCIELQENFDYFNFKNSITTNCLQFDQQFQCAKCNEQYTLISDSKQCIQNLDLKFCLVAQNSTQCIQCQKNYYLHDKKCFQMQVENCQQIDDSSNYCQGCIDGYFLFQEKCLQGQIQNCIQYQQNSFNNCKQCQEGYQIIQDSKQRGIQCLKINQLQSCEQLSHSIISNSLVVGCNQCKNNQGIIHENIQLGCQEIQIYQNCDQFDFDQNTCYKCNDLSYNMNGICLQRLNKDQLCEEYNQYIDSCKICEKDFLWDENQKKCMKIQLGIGGCLEYNSLDSCKICQKEFYLNEYNKCNRVQNNINGCKVYKDKYKCMLCDDFYQLEKDICIQGTIPNCLSWALNQQGKITCLKCQNGYFFEEIQDQIFCQKNQEIQYCLEYEQFQLQIYCKLCQESYYYEESKNICIKDNIDQPLIQNCRIYQYNYLSKITCSQCKQNYHLNIFQNKCIKTELNNIQSDCQILQELENPICKRCKVGHYLSQNDCLQCEDIDHCDFCNPLNPKQCLVCKGGYWITEDGICISFMGMVQSVKFIETNMQNVKVIFILKLIFALFI